MTMNENRKRKHDSISKNKNVDNSSDEENEDWFMDEEGGIRFEDIYIPPPSLPACANEKTGPRLMITKFVNENFKSYANEVIVGPFHKCFNAIVGPNGSGKSNVIDSMLFVFGYRATKIRSKKLSVLLHNSEAHSNIQSCTVAVHFQLIVDKEGDDYDVVPNSEFIVSRTAHKDNSSYYQLNGKRVQFKEIALLLRKYHIDLDHNRFLILQGEVEQIAMMKPKGANENESGMLEYLEDIIGTSRFKVPLQKIFDRLEILNDQRLEKLNRVKLIENEKNDLEGPMKEAVGFLVKENNITYKKNMVYQKEIKLTSDANLEFENKKNEIMQTIKQFEENLKKANDEKNEKEKLISETAKKYNDLEKRRDELKAAFDKANNRDIALAEEMQQKNKRRKKNIEQLKEERLTLEKLQMLPEKNEQQIEELTQKEQSLTIEKAKLEEGKTKLLSTLQKDTQELRDRREGLQTKLIDLNKAVNETKSEYTLAERELKICQSNEENERKKLESLREQFSNNEETYTSHVRTVKEFANKIPLTEKSLHEAQKELHIVKMEEASIIQDIRKKRINIEETRTSMQAATSKNRILNSLMKEKRDGNCPGLFGRLGDLGAIDQKYDVAVSTACGPLDNIVVDTVETAQWCIEYLKSNDIGRATFIALEKQQHLREIASRPLQTPENVARLYDLIRVEDPRVAPAFYYGLRDTLVANDLEQASRIAYGKKRFRVVTLRGDLIETSGTMSGGGRQVLKGRMGQQVAVKSNTASPEQVAAMESELQELEKRVIELRKKQASLEQQINALQPELQKMKIEHDKCNREIQTLKQLKPKLEKQIKEQELKSKSTKSDAEQVAKLTEILNTKKQSYDKAFAKANELQVQVDEITKEIDAKTKGKMKPIEQKLKSANEMLGKWKAEITKLKVAIKSNERNLKKSADKIASFEQDIKEAEESMKAMKKEREEIESDASLMMKSLEKIALELEEGKEDYADEKKAVEEIIKQINTLKSEKIEVDEKFKNIAKNISSNKSQIAQLKAKIAQLVLQEIPEETVEPLKQLTDEELERVDLVKLNKEINYEYETIKNSKPNLNAIKNYMLKNQQFLARVKELDELTGRRQIVREKYDEWKKMRLEEFSQGFRIITLKLKEMYQMITIGGDADLELVDTFDPFSEGVTFNVRPPKKTWKVISNLSGGEKTLSSLALVFALHYYKPSPLYVMDEIDAALDFKNVSIVGNYIKERTKNAQFIIISLRSNMFELGDYLVGIYKTNNCTHSITIDPRGYDKSKAIEGNSMDQQVPETNVTNKENTECNGNTEKNNSDENASDEELDVSK